MYKPVVPLLVDILKTNNTTTIINLASGGGGGLIWLNGELKKNPKLKNHPNRLLPKYSGF